MFLNSISIFCYSYYLKKILFKVDIDFKRLYMNASDMFTIYEKSLIKLVQILDDRIKDPSCRKMLEEMKKNVNISESKFNYFDIRFIIFCSFKFILKGMGRCYVYFNYIHYTLVHIMLFYGWRN